MQALAQLHSEIAACRDCELSAHRTRVVPGEGSGTSQIVFIGEAPGFNEDQQGRPFVGAAGKFLDELLASVGLRRQEVYICNVLKCRPPGNRDPLPGEIAACRKWLDRQLALISPRIIVTLGRYSMARYFPGSTISKIHGKERRVDGTIYFPMYHPAAALHQQSLRETIQIDMKRIRVLLDQTDSPAKPEQKPQQLTFF